MALLTPNDIRTKSFTTNRFKEGYDTDEVDEFLDEVTQTVEVLSSRALSDGNTQSLGADIKILNQKISQLTDQNEQLRSQLAQAQTHPQETANAADNNEELASAKADLSTASEQISTLTSQNEQLKGQVDQLNIQLNQLTAQTAQGDEAAAVKTQLDQAQAQNKALEEQLAAAQAQVDDLNKQVEAAKSDASAQQGDQQQLEQLRNQLKEAQQREEDMRAQLAHLEPSTETGSLQKIAGAANGPGSEPERATAMLTMAMQLHDQYVDKGKAENAKLLSEGQATKQSLIDEGQATNAAVKQEADEYAKKTRNDSEQYSVVTRSAADEYATRTRQQAEAYATDTRHEADDYKAATQKGADDYAVSSKAKLYEQTKVIEGNIESLKNFEGQYRERLSGFLNQLVSQISVDNYKAGSDNSNGEADGD